jgi:hypothetical protein
MVNIPVGSTGRTRFVEPTPQGWTICRKLFGDLNSFRMGPLRNWLSNFSNDSYYKQQRHLWACGKEFGDHKPNIPLNHMPQVIWLWRWPRWQFWIFYAWPHALKARTESFMDKFYCPSILICSPGESAISRMSSSLGGDHEFPGLATHLRSLTAYFRGISQQSKPPMNNVNPRFYMIDTTQCARKSNGNARFSRSVTHCVQ